MYWLNNRHLCPHCAGLREAEAKKIIDALIPKT